MEPSQNLPYPEHWEADVVVRDGSAAHIRPIVPEDASRLEELHLRLSPETIYYRYFTARPRLTADDLRYFTEVDYRDRVAFVATVGDELIGVVRYERLDGGHDDLSVAEGDIAEVAFVVRDDQQRRGIASVLLEHLAAAARERGVSRFAAEILPENRRMIAMFKDAGYRTAPSFGEGVVRLVSDLEHTETSLAVMRAREHRAESRSIERLLHPGAVAVIGVGRVEGGVGHTVLRHIREGGYLGAVYAVTPDADPAGSEVGGVPAYASTTDIPGPVDVAVVAVQAPEVLGVVRDCGAKGVHGLVVVSSGFVDEDADGAERQVELVRIARGDGMRVVGPNCLGVIVTDRGASLNATYARRHIRREGCGMFSQSSVFGVALLEAAGRRGVGLSSFVSAGNSADVSANDLLQYWEDDPNTAVVLMYLESTGNPRKFTRLARRISRSKPIVAVRSGRFGRIEPPGQATGRSTLPPSAGDALFAQAGVVQVDSIAELLDVGALLVRQPLPRGNRAAVVGNSDSLGFLAYDVGLRYGLRMREPVNLGERATADRLRSARRAAERRYGRRCGDRAQPVDQRSRPGREDRRDARRIDGGDPGRDADGSRRRGRHPGGRQASEGRPENVARGRRWL